MKRLMNLAVLMTLVLAAPAFAVDESSPKPPGLEKQEKTPPGLKKQDKTPPGWSHGKKTGWKKKPGPGTSEGHAHGGGAVAHGGGASHGHR